MQHIQTFATWDEVAREHHGDPEKVADHIREIRLFNDRRTCRADGYNSIAAAPAGDTVAAYMTLGAHKAPLVTDKDVAAVSSLLKKFGGLVPVALPEGETGVRVAVMYDGFFRPAKFVTVELELSSDGEVTHVTAWRAHETGMEGKEVVRSKPVSSVDQVSQCIVLCFSPDAEA
jgi:hypothetical protein